MLTIREIDAKIIKDLLIDGRKNFSEIGKECGVTKNKVWKHYRELEKKGIIVGATIQLNFASFGYEALATLLISVEAQLINQVMDYIRKIPEIRPYRQYNSIYNIRAVTTLKDINELDRTKAAIRRQLATNGLRTYIWTDVRNIPENLKLLTNKKNSDTVNEQPLLKPHIQKIDLNIDKIDLRIVDKLSSNGRSSFSKIAREIGTSTDTVAKRYGKLARNGVVKVSIQIDPNKLGYSSILDFNIAFAAPAKNTLEIVDSLAKIPDVIIITKTSGEYDLQLTAMIRDVEQMFSIQDEIAKTVGVTRIETSARKIPKAWPTPRQFISTF
jgi:Lrp/AsnC family leucine-responsive transcriptional regulator